MKLNSHRVDRAGDTVRITGTWQDRMRRPGSVVVRQHVNESVSKNEEIIIGDAHEVYSTLSGLADIAWKMGWRPEGLMGGIAHFVESYGKK